MKKPAILYKTLFALSAACLLAFAAFIAVDWSRYSYAANSAPFRVFVLARAVEFVLPGAAFLGAGAFLRRRCRS